MGRHKNFQTMKEKTIKNQCEVKKEVKNASKVCGHLRMGTEVCIVQILKLEINSVSSTALVHTFQ